MFPVRSLSCVIAIFLLSNAIPLSSARASSITGRVAIGATPQAGVMLTARQLSSDIAVTVFSNAIGEFALDKLAAGDYEVSIKLPGYKVHREQRSVAAETVIVLDQQLIATDDLSSIPSSKWLDLLPDGDMKREFILNCASCHEVGYSRVLKDNKPRGIAEWAEAIALMRGIDVYGLTPSDFDDAKYSVWLAEHLDADALTKLRPAARPSGATLRARITEYPVPIKPSLPHDLVLGPAGKVWITAFYNNVIWALDPASGSIETFPVNEKPEVMGQVRALNFDRAGQLWVLLGGTESLVRLNPVDGSIKTFAVGMYPHSIEIDSKGKIWFNDYISAGERLGSIDPVSGELSIFKIPTAGLTESQGLPLLYGLQIDSKDVVWGTMLAANKLFSFDTRTNTSKLFDMPAPNSGPRRPGMAPDGSIWIPEFNNGVATRFDPASETFSRHELGQSSSGPYDLAVDQMSGHVWAAASLGSSMIRLDPETGASEVFPFPTEPAYPRHIAIDHVTGDVWTTYSSMPDAEPKIVRVEINDPDRQ